MKNYYSGIRRKYIKKKALLSQFFFSVRLIMWGTMKKENLPRFHECPVNLNKHHIYNITRIILIYNFIPLKSYIYSPNRIILRSDNL
jgi:hypothetical protein